MGDTEPSRVHPKYKNKKKDSRIVSIIKDTLGGTAAGIVLGMWMNYLYAPPIPAEGRPPGYMKKLVSNSGKAAFWVGSAAFAYSLGKHVSSLFREDDRYTPAYGGALAGLVLSRIPPGQNMVKTALIVVGFAFTLFVWDQRVYEDTTYEHWHNIQRGQDEKVRLAYQHAVEKMKVENDKRLAELEQQVSQYTKN